MKNIFYTAIIILLAAFSQSPAKDVLVIDVDEGIGPATASYIENSVKQAEDENAEALIIRLNTPGGLLEATRDIVSSLLEADVPVVVYVSPGGGRAGSAGVFITMAANIAAMAPGTNIGSAHPVGIGGQADTSSVMFDKVTNDAAAFVRSIAQKRGRNQDWAERAVRESISASENEALEAGAIDVISPNLDSLLVQIDGMTVETAAGEVTLQTADSRIIKREKNWRETLLGILADPNFAYIFMMLAIYGILFELYNPGAIFPGVIGGISAVLAAYSLQMLPVNYAGLALILLAIILFIVEIKVTSYGMLTIGGIISLLIGSIMLIDSPFQFMDISLSIIITATVVTAAFFIFIIGLGLRAQMRKKFGGSEGLVGETGKAASDITPDSPGRARVHGEFWKAESDHEIKKDEEIVVDEVKNFVIKVSSIARLEGKTDK